MTPTILRGTIRDKTIELEEAPGLPDGQQVTVKVEPAPLLTKADQNALDALRRAAGSWSDDSEGLDQFLEWNRQQRKADRSRTDQLPLTDPRGAMLK
jgi:hypothetical protein